VSKVKSVTARAPSSSLNKELYVLHHAKCYFTLKCTKTSNTCVWRPDSTKQALIVGLTENASKKATRKKTTK